MKPIYEYRSVSIHTKSELKEKKSVFIGLIFPVKDETEIENLLQQIRREYPDANHHCYAYKLLNGKIKFADDGEPHRTAGLRIFNAIEYNDLNNVLLVVVRYFGGTKLGVGPLGKAYYDAASSAITKESIKVFKLYRRIKLVFDFSLETLIKKFYKSNKIILIQSFYITDVEYECLIPVNDEEQIIDRLKELTNGKIKMNLYEELLYHADN